MGVRHDSNKVEVEISDLKELQRLVNRDYWSPNSEAIQRLLNHIPPWEPPDAQVAIVASVGYQLEAWPNAVSVTKAMRMLKMLEAEGWTLHHKDTIRP